MRMHGYCEKCHKIKMISVSPSRLAMLGKSHIIPTGLCAQCEEDHRAQTRAR